MRRAWIKLYVEMLDDPKIGMLPIWLKWRFIELLLVAAEGDGIGELPPTKQLAWRLRVDEDDVLKSLAVLCDAGVVHQAEPNLWLVTNFEKRQAAMTEAERAKMYRERKSVTKRDGDSVTDSSSTSTSYSSSDSSLEGGGAGEGAVFSSYQSNIGVLTPAIADGLKADIDTYSSEWVLTAIDYATKQEKRSLAYVEGVLKGWKRDGLAKPSAGATGRKPSGKSAFDMYIEQLEAEGTA